ncbi:MAG: TonB-dependent receptor [Opitutaceae bacterium]|nr:TonB-dependent receptor [Opitutaceae bacterium]
MNQRQHSETHRLMFAMRALVALVVATLVGGTAFGQAITTSSLWGRVVSEGDAAVEGAEVSVVHEPTGTTYAATTRTDGTFVLRGLRPGGPYTVSASTSAGAKGVSRGVMLDIDRGAEAVIYVSAEEVVELAELKISESAVDQLFNATQTGSGSYLTSKDIADLPAGDRSINALARLDPRITYNRDPFDRAISVSGMSNRYNSIQVDGVSASDPFGLNSNNTAAERNVIPLDSLDALAVDSAPYNARNAGFVGARINAVTKSGTNQFSGSLGYTYRGRSAFGGMDMVGTELGGVEYPLSDFSEETFTASLGGPILKNKLFFHISYEEVKEDRIPPSPTAWVDQPTIDRIVAAVEALGFEPGDSRATSNALSDENIIVKVDWNINDDHRATLRYNNSESSRPTFPGFGTGISQNNFSFESHWYDQIVNNESFTAQLISRWSDRLNTEISASRNKYESEPINNSRQPSVLVRDVPVPGSSNTAFVNLGTEISRHANYLEVDSDTIEVFASYELSERNTLQAGLQYDVADTYNLFVQRAYGSYEFANLAQLESVAANNNGTVQYRLYSYNETIEGVNPAAEFSESNTGFFVNDVFRVTPTLSLNFGIRMDIAGLPDDVPYNERFFNTFGERNDYTYDGRSIIQPRFGFNWTPATEKRTALRGGLGLFYGRAPRVWISNSYSNTGMNFRSFTAGTSGGGLQAPVVSADPDNQPSTSSVPPAQQVAFMDRSFQLPSRWKANLAFERVLPFWDLKGTVEFERTWVEQDIAYENINIAQTGAGPDGRAMYFNAYGATASGTRLVNTGFTNRIIKLTNSDQGGTESLTFAVERPRKSDGWAWRAAYVYTDAEEVLFGTSSVAASNWNNRSVFNANEQELHRSELEITDRVTFNITKDLELFKGYRTTFSLFYDGHSGLPFSLTNNNVNNSDANGDGINGNDLIYVPMVGDSAVRFATATDQERFDRIVARFGLKRGQVVKSGSETYPWVNQFDFGIKQEIKLPGWRHRITLGFDILNVGNLINEDWGLIRGSNQFFVKREGVANVAFDGVNRQYVYSNVSAALADGNDFNPSLGRGEPAASRWSMLLSARYSF